jgi:hypothetical protein
MPAYCSHAHRLRLSLAQQDIKEVSRVVLQTKSIQDLITAALEVRGVKLSIGIAVCSIARFWHLTM